LPHWRADDVVYYATFRHRRSLDEAEMDLLFAALRRPDARRWDLQILCVLPEATELLVTVRNDRGGRPLELSDVIEKAKAKAGRQIVKRTGERFPPLYAESYDRIVRDDAEMEETWVRIWDSPVHTMLVDSPDGWPRLYVANAPEDQQTQ
jgi:hypothetical protein